MKIQTNDKLNIGYVRFKTGKVFETLEVRPGILLDLDKKGQLLGIEVLDLSNLAPAIKAFSKRTGKSERNRQRV
jgi:uncharacterized protein YuzE